jgi:hypothetical protein
MHMSDRVNSIYVDFEIWHKENKINKNKVQINGQSLYKILKIIPTFSDNHLLSR